MKITILSTAYPLRGGIAHFNGLLYKELSQNHSVKVITFKRQYPSILFPGKSQIENEDTLEEIPSSVEVDSINPLNWIKVGLKIKRDSPDLLIFKYWMPFFAPCFGTISRIAQQNKKTKILVICDNVIPHERKPGDVLLTKYFFSKADYFVLMSNTVKNDLLKVKHEAIYKLSFHPVYTNFGDVIDKDIAKEKLKLKSTKIILFFGFIRKYKGLDILLKAAALIKDKMDFEIVVAGEFYDNEEKYISLIRELSLKDNVRLFKDFIPTSDVKYFFSAADVVVLPYKDATQSGIVQIANNFGKPVIATNVGGLAEIIEENVTGNLVEKENPEQLANAIQNYYELKKETEYSNNIMKKLDQYSWSNFGKEIISFVNKDNSENNK